MCQALNWIKWLLGEWNIMLATKRNGTALSVIMASKCLKFWLFISGIKSYKVNKWRDQGNEVHGYEVAG